MKRIFSTALFIQIILCFFALFSPAVFADNTAQKNERTIANSEIAALDNGQILYSKSGGGNSVINVRNEADKGCLVIVYEDYYDIFDDSEDGMILLKFYVDANSTAEIECQTGTYGVRAVFGENYIPRKDNHEEYRMATGRFEKEYADYIVGTDIDFESEESVDIKVSIDDAEKYEGTVPYMYYVSYNHTWADRYNNERSGLGTKTYYFRGYSYQSPAKFSNGYYEPF